MRRILAIETSAETCSVALDVGGEVVERFEHAPMKHAELILPSISSVLAEAGLAATDLDAIAFGRGPGSFTSLRIGIGVVQGLAWGADRPVVPVSSLAAVAQVAAGRLDVPPPGEVVSGGDIAVAMDARMAEVFHAVFRVGQDRLVTPVGPERVGPPKDVVLGESSIAAGNGFDRYEDLANRARGARACMADAWPRASAVLKLASAWLDDNEPLTAAMAQPVYLRNNVADKPGEKRG
ncbi:MAG: tRNA (adenosine(37)-N6)-threonylcarbamoyltransferase complex dimerization subunit type 1 TsaB [Gammaproteobacteria bacterium]|nr:tRNA (adenosine(37)-N6)-threonylcarbamoyltransferase complex dimerization subunit type 1 TsaB [Gammaproteobacteria bacterium]MBT8057528.1 tRNA (adenosine(37)-N6)-threonylcarbamoyltransferase complex dimerization subunit type 1 TsaB [Gammaproteobacteria bacterium]NNJ77999.1 tRNA (adenosine(37)-N6)-threonylcarbamoyltransferase complex dimerization subunit type 1 TsaB [Xanthomonadales bacterium]